ncbi:MAG TPA: SCO family protein, partial [Anaerolineales bacterium]
MKRLMLLASFAILLAAGVYFGLRFFQPYQLHGSVLSDPKLEGDIFLRSAEGPLRLSDYRGKYMLLYFGYTHCPDICPTSLAKMKAALAQLPLEQAEQVQVLFVSVDPGRDTPQASDDYARVFSPAFSGATGTPVEIALVAESLGVTYKIGAPAADSSYTVEHSSYIYVIDRQGYLVMNWGHDIQPDEIASDLGYLLEHGIPLSAQLLAGPTQTPVVCGLTLIPAHVQGGEWLYGHHCAQCHGANLEGNPAWETELADGSHLPPPLNSEGTIWRHSEADLIELIKSGRNLDKAIHMPAFKGVLSDWEIHFILQYAASKWDVNQRN